MMKYTLTLALGVVLLSSCTTETTPTDAVSVVGNWELVSFNLNDGTTTPSTTRRHSPPRSPPRAS